MKTFERLTGWGLCALAVCLAAAHTVFAADEYKLEVFPREDKVVTDEATGAKLLFLTTSPAKDTDLYFHQRSWLADSSMILFASGRERGGLMGYLVQTGELVRLATADGGGLSRPTAAVNHNSVFAMAGDRCVEIGIRIEISKDPAKEPSKVFATERLLCTLPAADGYLNESCDGQYLASGQRGASEGKPASINIIRIKDGSWERLCDVPPGVVYAGHVQWSHTNPNLLSFAASPIRIWVIDIRNRKPWAPYQERPGELVTHESWWVDDQILFCGGVNPKPTEDSHLKLLNPLTGMVRIIGEGAWWPGATPAEIAKRNWWHASGSQDGRWVAGDNWHGDIMLFEGLTARPRLLTSGHRTYGKGAHPEVGWDRKGEQVIFTSNKFGNEDICVATIPEAWQEETSKLGRRIEEISQK